MYRIWRSVQFKANGTKKGLSMDRRIRKSQEAIIEAFIQLIAEKNFEQITINEIAERANVSRGTVYSHFTDKYDLLDQCIRTHFVKLIDSCLPCGEQALFFPQRRLCTIRSVTSMSTLPSMQRHWLTRGFPRSEIVCRRY
ncbi:TetR/AcrR family transcriptional regulator [Paenibacillus rhizoplanae]